MLRYLRIRNLAVIEAVAVEFESGLNVLTGETGAGKSILVEAVGLLLGGRASSDLVRTGAESADIEALFEHDGREVVVRREVTAQGRSRAFVDGALATAGALRDLADTFIELHGQHEHQVLGDPETHLDLLDTYAGLGYERQQTMAAYEELGRLGRELDAVRMDEREKLARIDLLTFQRDEIARIAPRHSEDEELASARQVLVNAERLRRLSAEAYAALYDSDGAALSALTSVWRKVDELATLDPRAAAYLESRDAIKSQLEDLAFFLRGYGDGIEASPGRLQEVEDRLAQLERLKRKYGPTLGEVTAHLAACTRELEDLARLDDRAAELSTALDRVRQRFLDAARALQGARRGAAGDFGRRLESTLADLAMTRTRFEVRFNDEPLPEAAWTARGIDRAEFFVSANPGEDLRPLARIASGGELSRIMLALRSLSGGMAARRTLIFDEVDAGIGGRAADQVGRKLQEVGKDTQVLCITHLPQIAACGRIHFQVSKSVDSGRTVTSVRRLEGRARTEELARMMAGEVVSAGVLASAAELLANRGFSSETPDFRPSSAAAAPGAKGERPAKGESESRRLKAKGRS